MEIFCNGARTSVAGETTLDIFLRNRTLNPDTVAVECDGVILARDSYEGLILREGMVLEVIRFVGGGSPC
jgi:thiamine biosynthesis protein ThiS